MKVYILTEDQMRAYWALERAAAGVLPQHLEVVREANTAAEDLPTEAAERIAAERLTHTGRGWTAEHDAGHVSALLAAAVSYVFAADGIVSTRHPIYRRGATPPVPWPWGEHYWKPADEPQRNLEKAGALLAAALDAVEAATQ